MVDPNPAQDLDIFHRPIEGIFLLSLQYKGLSFFIRKSKEEIIRFLDKLTSFYSIMSLDSLSLLEKNENYKLPEKASKKPIDHYISRIKTLILLDNKKNKKKNLGTFFDPLKIPKNCEKLINVLLMLEESYKGLLGHLELNRVELGANSTNYIKVFEIKDKILDTLTTKYMKFIKEYFKCLQIVHQFIEFTYQTEVSQYDGVKFKYKEGYIYKRTGGRDTLNQRFFYICKYFRRLQKRWLITTDKGLVYLKHHRKDSVQRALDFKDNFILISDESQTKYPDALIIRTNKEKFLFHSGSRVKKLEWQHSIETALNWYKKTNPEKKSEGISFPIRSNNKAKWYVDGEGYFSDIYRALLSAEDRIFITDWWLCAELYLLRPAAKYPESQIFKVFEKIVKEKNVKIFVHMYREPEPALDLGSEFTSRFLTENPILKNNVKVIRHPERGLSGLKLFYAHHEKICVIDDKVAFMGGIDLCYGRWDTQEHKLVDDPNERLFPGADYSNPRLKEVIDIKVCHVDQHPLSLPRMPWHDIGLCIEGPAAADASSHFMDLWNWANADSANFKRKNQGVLSSRVSSVQNIRDEPSGATLGEGLNERVLLKFKTMVSKMGGLLDFNCDCQILRSVGDWSYGIPDTEHSIMDTYVKLIRESKYFIYIENQFFISSTAGSPVSNTIAQELVDRIKLAHKNNEDFRVIVCMPLLPAFEGEIREDTAGVLKIQLYWEYLTIFRSNTSIYKQLESERIPASKYINFYGLRTHALLNDYPVTEIVYIHSKCMIVDDDIAIIGSANINDRSMLGDHDSEIACVINDQKKTQSYLNGEAVYKGNFAFSMRKRIFDEFLGNETRMSNGEDCINVEDPLCKEFIDKFEMTAKTNTNLYFEFFRCYPSDEFKTFNDLKKTAKEAEDSTIRAYRKKIYKEQCDKIKGFIVEFPRYFLSEENLKPSRSSKEGMAPTEVFI